MSNPPVLFRRWSALLALAAFSISGLVHAKPAERPRMPDLQLAGEQRGEAAVQALGAQLPAVAAHYRMTPQKLDGILKKDRSSRLDRKGRLFYVEPAGNAMAGDSPSVSAVAPYDLSQTFLLQSRPGAKRVIYLDFNGHSLSGSAWNGGAAINAQAYDTDGNPGSFSSAELDAIQKIWQRVAEDYAPFDVNVTTADPGVDAIRRSSSTDEFYGSRVVITRNNFYNCSCGGVAYVGTFDYYGSNPDYYQPAWVFFDALGNGYEKYVAEAATHEAGHNLGLSHDGRTSPSEGYYAGHGSGDTGWAPIMGVGYSKNLSQWSKGEYAYASNTQDDVIVIGQNGVSQRADDAGNSPSTATALGGSSSNGNVVVSRSGVLHDAGDMDVYSFVAGAGSAQFTLTPAAPGPNVDLRAEILDANGDLVASASPSDRLDATLSVNLAGGSYYLVVDGVGLGTPSTGYSDYGSIGQYQISASHADAGASAPLAAFTAAPASGLAPLPVSFDASASSDSDGVISSYHWNFGNGASASGMTPSYTYTTPGSYVVTLTVTDSSGLTDTQTMSITVDGAPAPQPPNAALSVSSTSGTAPLSVSFNGNGSTDSDGSIVSYSWNFGNGSSASGATASTTYNAAGTYTATLTVTDSDGLSDSASVQITVAAAQPKVSVKSITVKAARVSGGYQCTATVGVQNGNGAAVRNATVAGAWSGTVSGSVSGRTGSTGFVSLKSAKTSLRGACTFTVNSISASGYGYTSPTPKPSASATY